MYFVCHIGGTVGSPPRMRGKPLCSRPPTAGSRITPAYAGKTPPLAFHFVFLRDHPRVCGENLKSVLPFTFSLGSPPRMRGKLKISFANSHDSRITPAYAGKTGRDGATHKHCKDHPRVCGENPDLSRLSFANRGSPPRMRGKRLWQQRTDTQRRITPAYAGKTARSYPLPWPTAGSPPRMRGKPSNILANYRQQGITPAYAGKTFRMCNSKLCLQDHPRVCGENCPCSCKLHCK